MFGQELNAETYAICRSDMMLKGQDASNIKFGNSFIVRPEDPGHQGDQHPTTSTTCSPTRRSGWSGRRSTTSSTTSTQTIGFAGRFGAGLPRINDGSFLFLQHMISKMSPPEQGGSRLAIVFNGSPLFTGAAGSGEIGDPPLDHRERLARSHRRPARPAFYNTGISTYFWIVTNRKSAEPQGKVQLIDARDSVHEDAQEPRREAQGDQRRPDRRDRPPLRRLRSAADRRRRGRVKIFPNEAFGFLRITVERPLRLRWEVTDDASDALLADKKLAKLDRRRPRGTGRTRPRTRVGTRFDSEAAAHARKRSAGWPSCGLTGKPIENAIVDALAVRDPDADPITDKKGNPEPDPDLRDNENVPLPERPARYEPDATDRSPPRPTARPIEEYVEPRSSPTSPTPGSTTTRPRSATRSPSPATSTSTPHPGRSPRSTPRSSRSKPRSRRCSAR